MTLVKHFSEDKNGMIDIKLLVNQLMKKNRKQLTYIPSSKELPEYADFLDYMYKKNPLFYAFIPMEMRCILFRAVQLGEEENIGL
jgi:hypothetical protein